MKGHIRFSGALLLLLLAALAIAPIGCRKKTPAPQAVQQDQPLVGEVNPAMTSQLLRFVEEKGRLPTNFAELARSRLDLVPRHPPGMKWAVDSVTREVKLVKE